VRDDTEAAVVPDSDEGSLDYLSPEDDCGELMQEDDLEQEDDPEQEEDPEQAEEGGLEQVDEPEQVDELEGGRSDASGGRKFLTNKLALALSFITDPEPNTPFSVLEAHRSKNRGIRPPLPDTLRRCREATE
jgi:hypothetical protein